MPFAQALIAAGFRVAMPSMRGYWPSTRWWPYDADALADDVVALFDALGPAPARVLIGHDWGSVVAHVVASRRPRATGSPATVPLDALVTLSVPHPIAFLRNATRSAPQLWRSRYMLEFQLGALADARAAAGDFAAIDRLIARWSPGFTPSHEHRARLHEVLMRSHPAPLEYYRALLRPPAAALARARALAAARIATPTLNLMGANDGCIAPAMARGQEAFFRGPFESEVVDGVGHFLAHEAPAAIAARVVRFWGAHERVRAPQ